MARKRRGNNEGSVYYSDVESTWIGEITLPNGKRRKKRNKDKKAIQDWLLKERSAIADNRVVESLQMKYGDLLDKFLEDVAAHSLKRTTLNMYEVLIRVHIKPALGKYKLVSLTPMLLQSFYTDKLNEGLSTKTVKHLHALIRRTLNQAIKWNLLATNPCSRVTPPKVIKKPFETLTEGEARQFLAAVANHRFYPLYVLALTTGMRRGEVLGLRWEDVDFKNKSLSIVQTVQAINGQIRIAPPKTSGSKRTIHLSEYALSVLKEYNTGGMGLIVTTASGKPVSPRNLVRHFKLMLEREGLPNIRFHDLRHTAATFLLKENVHPKVVQEMLGHSSIQITLDVYSHLLPSMQSEAAGKMDGIFKQDNRSNTRSN